MPTSYLLADDARNPSYAKVDDLTVIRGGPAVDLSDDQIARLHKAGLISQADLDGSPLPSGPTIEDVFLSSGSLAKRAGDGTIEFVDSGVGVPDGSVKVSTGSLEPAQWSQALDTLPIPAYGSSDFVSPAPLSNLFSANGIPGATNRLNLVRVISPRKGRIRHLHLAVSALPTSGVFEAGIFDANGYRLWTTGSQTATSFVPALGWLKLGDPKIPVDSGEPLYWGFVNDSNTLGAYRYPVGNVLGMDLPYDLAPESNGKISGYLPGQTSLPTVIDFNSVIGSTLLWAMLGRVSG